MKTKTSAPAVYVGTRAKYNNGSIEGCWFNDLTVFETESDFLAAARKFHQDEKDPEFMYEIMKTFLREWLQNMVSTGLMLKVIVLPVKKAVKMHGMHGFLIPVIPVSNSSGGVAWWSL